VDELCKLLPRFLNKHVRGDQAPVLEVLTPLWPRVAGKAVAAQSRPVAFGNGTLTIAASSSPWSTELRGLHDEIRTTINRTLGRPLVKRIRVKLASMPSSDAGGEVASTLSRGNEGSLGRPALRMQAMPSEASALVASQKEFGLQTGLDPEVRETFVRSFAKYFGRANGRVS
jgi:hypothetical protein